jgi:plasmid maintenance system antidote protein VapI
MSKSESTSTITAFLRDAIVESGIPYKTLSRETGVARASIQRFVAGRQSIRLDMADRLAAYFGILVVPKARPKRSKSEP